jgi:hypothetical protein
MKLTPMRPMLRSATLGCACGLVLVVGFLVWRGLHYHAAGRTALGFAAGAAGMAAIAVPLALWWMRRSTRKAQPMPSDAEPTSGRRNWWFALAGALLGVRAVGRGLNDDVVTAAVMGGIVLGGAIAFGVAQRWLSAWEAEHGRELLQRRDVGWRKKGPAYFLRDLHPAASNRFAREQEAVGTR